MTGDFFYEPGVRLSVKRLLRRTLVLPVPHWALCS